MMLTGVQVINSSEVISILDAACQILEKTGIEVENAEILKRLSEYGGSVNYTNNRITFKRNVIEKFLSESEKIDWKNKVVKFSAGAGIFKGYYLDPEDEKFKEWTEEKLIDYVMLANALPNIRGVSMLGCPLRKISLSEQPLYEKLYSWKYGISGTHSIWHTELCEKIYRMHEVYADEKGKQVKDIYNGYVYLISPLKFGSVEAEQFMWFYKNGLATQVKTMGSIGGTTPVTLAGALALHIAEYLFINILNRVFFNRKILNMGNSISVLDMSNGAFRYGRPEKTLLNLAGAQVARYLGAQYKGQAGQTDAMVPGYEAGVQKVTSTLLHALACGWGSITAGMLGVDEIFSPLQMILDDEITGSIKRICSGFEVNDQTLALDIIDEIGPGGTFFDTDHTALNFRKSLWQSSIWSKEMYSVWKDSGKKNDIDRAKEKYISIVNENPELEPNISEKTEKKLLQIIKS